VSRSSDHYQDDSGMKGHKADAFQAEPLTPSSIGS
ncbi:MAG: hypothetical protein H6Q64_2071, partial [Firmicutes bacterium]|nr:hypothetical protein [Bacillota bacterium]